jgi:RNA recognition motif-containing protein
MSKKIYVGNMNYATTEGELSNLFAQYGEVVSVNIVKDRYTGQAKALVLLRWSRIMTLPPLLRL